jgi:hypothetical protein
VRDLITLPIGQFTTSPYVFAPWASPIKRLASQLMVTNLLPLIIINYEPQHLIEIATLIELPRIRTIILCGHVKPANVIEVDPVVEYFSPLGVLKHFVRTQP